MAEFIQEIFQRGDARGVKSTALHALGWLLVILLTGLAACLKVGASDLISVAILVLIVITVLVYLGIFCFFSFTNPDLLRSEKFTLTKLAIERSAKGDNLTGLIDSIDSTKLLPPSSDKGGE